MDMKTHHLLFILIALPLFCSCRSSRSMLREIQALKSSLYYELTSPIYQEKADQTVYLDFIDYSNMDYYTSVKRKKSAYIPLLLYNYEGAFPSSVRRVFSYPTLSGISDGGTAYRM